MPGFLAQNARNGKPTVKSKEELKLRTRKALRTKTWGQRGETRRSTRTPRKLFLG